MPITPNTWLDDFVVNTNPNGSQRDPVVTQLASGHILVVWWDPDSSSTAGSPAGDDIIGRIFDPLGNPVTDEIRLNTRNTGANEFNPSVTALSDGGFVIAYDEQQTGSYDDLNIETYSFDPVTATVTSTADGYLFNDPTQASDTNPVNPVIASASSTSVMGAYQKQNPDGSETIILRTYNPTTGAVGAEITVYAGASGAGEDMSGPDIAALSNGNYAITFVNQNPAPSVDDLLVSIYNQAGTALSTTTLFSLTDLSDPQVVALSNGYFVVAFSTSLQSGNVAFRVVGNNGVALPNTYNAGNTANSENEPAIVALADGTFVIARDDDTTGQIVGERFEIVGTAVNIVSGFVIDDTGGGSITDISMAALADGRFTVTWDDGVDIRMKILDTRDFVNADAVYNPEPNWQVGTVGNDVFDTDDDADIVHGWTGNDIITQGVGSGAPNQYFGDAGDDILLVRSGIDADSWDGGVGGIDTIDLSLSTESGLVINLTAGTIAVAGFTEVATNFENATGSAQNDTIIGNAGGNILKGLGGNDVLNGGGSGDTMQGGAGNDTYFVDNAGDVVDESVGGSNGLDTVRSSISFSLVASGVVLGDVENVILLGAGNLNALGNALNNTLTGNTGANTLNGGVGADTMQGGVGNDTYTVDNAGDIVDESTVGANGIDTVRSTISFSLVASATVKGLVENVTLLGAGNLNALGNDAANILIGNTGANTLNGGLGADTMQGGAGNDTYTLDNAGDVVDESVAGSSGIDLIRSTVTVNLTSVAQVKGVVENVTLLGAANAIVYGNTLANVIIGNTGANVLAGGLGNDTLTGGTGNDIFLFNTALGAANVDTITDMNQAGNDTIRLDDSIFNTLATGALAAGAFVTGTQALDANDRIIYNVNNGQLIYDTNGSALGGATVFAVLDAGLAITAADFFVV